MKDNSIKLFGFSALIVAFTGLTAFAGPTLQNGDFITPGLSGWTVEYGTVTDGGGYALFEEDPFDLSSTLSQGFTLPKLACAAVICLVGKVACRRHKRRVMRGKEILRAVACVSRFGRSFACAVVGFSNITHPPYSLNNHFEQINTCSPLLRGQVCPPNADESRCRYDIVNPAKAETIYAIRNGGNAYGEMS